MSTIRYLIGFVVLLSSCTNNPFNWHEDTLITIHKGTHSVFHAPVELSGNQLHKSVTFLDDCQYHFDDVDNLDLNKLTGIAWGDIHQNSYRIGWRYNTEKHLIELFNYVYIKGKRTSSYITDVQVNDTFDVDINIDKDKFFAYLDGKQIYDGKITHSMWFICYPYFGGQHTAPHDIHIRMKD